MIGATTELDIWTCAPSSSTCLRPNVEVCDLPISNGVAIPDNEYDSEKSCREPPGMSPIPALAYSGHYRVRVGVAGLHNHCAPGRTWTAQSGSRGAAAAKRRKAGQARAAIRHWTRA